MGFYAIRYRGHSPCNCSPVSIEIMLISSSLVGAFASQRPAPKCSAVMQRIHLFDHLVH